ncbi:glycoside hydrolase family 127 protein [Xylariomycetidae sp. FL2044]|nr:glycoside hydrolase family 127 protein [Xylariomycetidae sp. FL2044]
MAYPQTLFPQTTFHGPSMLATRRATVSRVTIKAQLKKLKDTGRYYCFNLKWQPVYDDKSRWPAPPSLYWDSDVAKWMEGACYLLSAEYDPEIDAAVREITDMIRGAQQADGYLNVYFTVIEPEKRWSNIRDQHELYNAGHLIEAALAHSNYYKNDLLIEPIQKYVKLIRSVMGPEEGKRHAYPGHPETELALLRLYTATGNQDAYDLAKFFIEERGNPKGQEGMRYFEWERRQRGESPWKRPDCYPMHTDHWYSQAHAPILEHTSVEGHAVRAMYLYTGVADLVCLDKLGVAPYQDSSKYFDVLKRLWNNMVDKKMYLTGGVGSMWQWEGFGIDYFLPQGSAEGGCYNETCASIGVMMLAERLLHLDLNSKYADIIELCLYNNVMTGMSLEGSAFTYVNQLASSDADKSGREEWFDTSCCPPNVSRLFGSIGGYLWDYGGSGNDAFINVHLYTTAQVTFEVDGRQITLEQKSNWPWEGSIQFQLRVQAPLDTTLRLRIPSWADGKYALTPSCSSAKVQNGYLILPPAYTAAHPAFTLDVGGFKPRFIAPHPYTNQNTLALARGPLVYCVEDFDNPWELDHFQNVGISAGTEVTEEEKVVDGLGERYIELRAAGWIRKLDQLDRQTPGVAPCFPAGVAVAAATQAATEVQQHQQELVFVPYYLRANRGGRGHMRVGLLR